MPRETQPLHFEYVDKSTYWPRWSLPPSLPHDHAPSAQQNLPASQAPSSQALVQSTTQPSVSFVVINQTSRPIPMQFLYQLASRYIPQQPTQLQQPQQTSSTQPAPQQTVVIVIGQNGAQAANTDDILNRLFMSQQPQTIPASQSFIDSLQQIPITQDIIAKHSQCTVCMEDFHVDDKATKLPCLHYFHEDCIKPWLRTSHTCPMCRHELPTDTPTQIAPQMQSRQPLLLTSSQQTTQQAPSPQLSSPLPAIEAAPVSTSSSVPVTSSSSSSPSLSSTPSDQSLPAPSEDLPSSGTKRSPLSPTEEQVNKKAKVETKEESTPAKEEAKGDLGLKRGFLLKNEEQTNKKSKKDDKKEKGEEQQQQQTRRRGGNEFGFKRGFLL